MPSSSQLILVDGSLDWSGGVDSVRTTTTQSERNPNGLARNKLAWLINATVRGGGITQRTGWKALFRLAGSTGLFQGGYMYEPDYANPYLVIVISGSVFQVLLDGSNTVINLSSFFADPGDDMTMTPTEEKCWFCQAELFLVIQDSVKLPLFWDGSTLRRSVGITDPAPPPSSSGVNEIPVATCMDYYMGRLWYAQGSAYFAGDIVGGPSGTHVAPTLYNHRDAVLNVTESPLVVGGDGFRVPATSGNIRALKHSANLDTALGQGQLFIFTRKQIFSLSVPVTRMDWIGTTADNTPLQRVVQMTNGAVNDRSVVAINGDLFYQSLEPAIRSWFMAVRDFSQWANVAVSSNIDRMMVWNDRALLHGASGIVFDNRMLQTSLPKQMAQGIVHQGLAVLDFVPLSTMEQQLPPVWEGVWEGLDFLQLFTGDFGGLERGFAAIVSRVDQSIQLWEITDYLKFEADDTRVTWVIETPAYTWGHEFELKKLVAAELWIDKLFGEVVFNVEYRPDGDVCWHFWHSWKECTARNSCEDEESPVCYPQTDYRESFRSTVTLPLPPIECQNVSNRPVNIGYQFQIRITVKGWARIRGLLLHAELVDRKTYQNLVC